MKFRLSKKTIMAVAATVMVLGLSIGGALAYFSASTEAKGGFKVDLGSKTTITEELDGLNKIITVTNADDTEAYVRVTAGYNDALVTVSSESEGWVAEGDTYYYQKPLAPAGSEGSSAVIKFIVTPKEGVTQDFDVVITEESTQYIFKGVNNGNYEGWKLTADPNVGYK